MANLQESNIESPVTEKISVLCNYDKEMLLRSGFRLAEVISTIHPGTIVHINASGSMLLEMTRAITQSLHENPLFINLPSFRFEYQETEVFESVMQAYLKLNSNKLRPPILFVDDFTQTSKTLGFFKDISTNIGIHKDNIHFFSYLANDMGEQRSQEKDIVIGQRGYKPPGYMENFGFAFVLYSDLKQSTKKLDMTFSDLELFSCIENGRPIDSIIKTPWDKLHFLIYLRRNLSLIKRNLRQPGLADYDKNNQFPKFIKALEMSKDYGYLVIDKNIVCNEVDIEVLIKSLDEIIDNLAISIASDKEQILNQNKGFNVNRYRVLVDEFKLLVSEIIKMRESSKELPPLDLNHIKKLWEESPLKDRYERAQFAFETGEMSYL